MKNLTRFLLTAFSAALLSLTALAQTAFEQIAADPLKAGGIYNLYNENPGPCAPAPKGYKPFYISHYGRHGARYLSSNSQFRQIRDILLKAREDDALTEKGKDFCDRYLKMFPLVDGRGGDLTEAGAREHRGIAQRMIDRNPQVFRGKRTIDARSTDVPRCIISMDNFCDQLKRNNPDLRIGKTVRKADMAFLNPHSKYNPDVTPTDEGYNNKYAYWQDAYKQMCRENTDSEVFFGRLFKDWNYVSRFGNPMDLEILLYYLCCGTQCMESEFNFWDLFTFEEKCLLWEADSYRFFCSKGPDDIQGGRQWAFCWTLAQDILDGYDKDMAEGRAARLRFGHDIAIMSFMTLMGIEGWSTPAPSPHDAKDLWQDFNIPMGANIQFIFYRNRRGHVLVRFMNNENDIRFPIPSETAPYYDWNALRTYIQGRIDLARRIIATTEAPPKK